MPRKTAAAEAKVQATMQRFNEAAARCRGKPAAGLRDVPSRRHASMRPRPDAAENLRRAADRAGRLVSLQ